jgi:uncharacterized membrane protein (UPF0127 family)
MIRFKHTVQTFALLFVGALVVTGCNHQSANSSNSTATAVTDSNAAPATPKPALTLATDDALVPKKANPKLQTIDLYVGPHVMKTELALNDQQIRTGMMYRTNIAENEAMLFVFSGPHRAGFWMKNVEIPLDGAYINPEGVILQIVDMKPHDETALNADTDRVQFVLETKHGWFERNGVKPGMLITTERGTLKDSFRFGPSR